jgi:hypothetical protein
VRCWLVLVVAPAWFFTRPATHGSIRYELRSVSARDDYAGGDQLLMHERLANRASLSMCRIWDMDDPVRDATA